MGRQRDVPGAAVYASVGLGEEDIMKNLIVRFVREDAGQDLIEYALLAGLISLASVVAITALGTAIQGKFTSVGTAVSGAGS
jgi:pilus assembly protein Flp/PilA